MLKREKDLRSTLIPKKDIPKSVLEHAYVVAKKLLRHFEIDPDLLDSFTKKQRQFLLKVIFETPSIKPEKEKSIPRQYVENIRKDTFHYMKTNYFGKPENQLTYMDLATYGLGFYTTLHMHATRRNTFAGTPQEATAKMIAQKFEKEVLFSTGFNDVLSQLRYLTRCYSQVNIRLYGFTYDWKTGISSKLVATATMQLTIRLTVQNREEKIFTSHGIKRKAYRLLVTAYGFRVPTWAIIRKKIIFPTAHEYEYYNIYIQQHVLHRIKERLDIFDPPIRNFLTQYALTNGQIVAECEKQKLLAFTIYNDRPLGYLTFFIQGIDIVINTFIPLASETTPEGKKLHDLLPLSKEEIIYLGMDKLSFYIKVDFEQIPMLKQALIDSGIWATKLELDGMIIPDEGEELISKQKTILVKSFFDKTEQYRNMEEE